MSQLTLYNHPLYGQLAWPLFCTVMRAKLANDIRAMLDGLVEEPEEHEKPTQHVTRLLGGVQTVTMPTIELERGA